MSSELAPKDKPDSRSVDDVPLATLRTLDALMKRFSAMLESQAICNMKRRGSDTPTDADLEDAFRHLTRQKSASRAQKIIGDGLLILGGLLMPLLSTSIILTGVGVILCAVGLYVREFIAE